MTSPSTPPQAGRSVATALFEREDRARQAIRGLGAWGISERQLGLLVAGAARANQAVIAADVHGLLAAANQAGDLTGVLVSMGVPEGEARFCASEVAAGRALVVIDTSGSDYGRVRDQLLRNGGYDVRSRGAALVRGDGAGVSGGVGPLPVDLTGQWQDVASRYEMLFDQHYGTTDLTWPQVEPVYRFAWEKANKPGLRGRPWSEVAGDVQRDWESAPRALPWGAAGGPIHDVWDDVAEEAATGAEGGQDRRIPRQGTDQAGPARDL